MPSLLSPVGIAVLIVAAGIGAIVGGVVYVAITSRPERRNCADHVRRSALLLREGLLRQFPPGPRPEIRIGPADDFAEEQWEHLVACGMAVETAQGYRLVEWGPEGGIPLRDVLGDDEKPVWN